ncbi:MAG: hypothetical protein L6R35_004031 [Caloplaca aegaea]|nr:MAG: hypothetical protein L6R35_004031 [Caloplaca aegaea]
MIIVIDLMYGPIAFCAKLSLFLLYYRLFSRHRWIRYLVYFGIGSVAAMYTAGTIVYGYLCLPRPGQSWIEAGLSARCHDQFIMISYVRGPFNLLSDLYLFLLPLPAVWQLHLPLRKKMGIAGIFLTGSLYAFNYDRLHDKILTDLHSACIASIFGLYFRVLLYRSPDLTWNLAPVLATLYIYFLLSWESYRTDIELRVVELNIGTICASLPTLPAFYKHHRLKPAQLAALRTMTNKFRPFRSSRTARNDCLDTAILGSAKGEGKFLTSGDLTKITASTDVTRVPSENASG